MYFIIFCNFFSQENIQNWKIVFLIFTTLSFSNKSSCFIRRNLDRIISQFSFIFSLALWSRISRNCLRVCSFLFLFFERFLFWVFCVSFLKHQTNFFYDWMCALYFFLNNIWTYHKTHCLYHTFCILHMTYSYRHICQFRILKSV